jgi:hypothetical protein
MHMTKLKLACATALLFGSLVATASAMPVAPLPADAISNVDQVRWVCNPWGRCWWRPNYYGYYAYAPRYYGGWGWRHRGWRHRW